MFSSMQGCHGFLSTRHLDSERRTSGRVISSASCSMPGDLGTGGILLPFSYGTRRLAATEICAPVHLLGEEKDISGLMPTSLLSTSSGLKAQATSRHFCILAHTSGFTLTEAIEAVYYLVSSYCMLTQKMGSCTILSTLWAISNTVPLYRERDEGLHQF